MAKAIRESHLIVLLLSRNANASKWVTREIALAIKERRPIIPFRLEKVEPAGGIELHLQGLHWLDGFPPPMGARLDNLEATVRSVLDSARKGATAQTSRVAAQKSWRRPTRRRMAVGWVIATCSLALAGLCLWALLRMGRDPKAIVVSREGADSFRSIQSAINAASADSVIEILDGGTYHEALKIPESKPGITIRGKDGLWPVVSLADQQWSGSLVEIHAEGTTLEGLVLVHETVEGAQGAAVSVRARGVRLSHTVVHAGEGVLCLDVGHRAEAEVSHCVLLGVGRTADAYSRLVVHRSLWLRGGARTGEGPTPYATFVDSVVHHMNLYSPGEIRSCTVPGGVYSWRGGIVVRDSIISAVTVRKGRIRVERTNLYQQSITSSEKLLLIDCLSADPGFIDPQTHDYRLRPTSPCRGKAQDGGDLGCRHTPEMVELLSKARELRDKGIISF